MKDKSDDQDSVFRRAWEIINKDASIPDEEKEAILKLIQVLVETAESTPYPREKNNQVKTFAQEIISKHSLLTLVKQQANELDALRNLSLNLTSSLDLQTVLDAIVSEAMRLVRNASAAHIFLYLHGKLDFGASLISDGVRNKSFSMPRKDDLTYTVANSKKLIIIEDMVNHPIYVNLDKNQVGSIIGVPLMINNNIVGVMNLSRSIVGEFSRAELRLIGLLADQAAIAIQNAQQYEELRQTKGLVGSRTALAWMGLTSSAWAHAIGNSAVNIRTAVELIRRNLKDSNEIKVISKQLEMIERSANQIRVAPITAPLSAEEGVQSISLNELIRERARQLWASEPYQFVNLILDFRIENTINVRVSPEWLRRVFDIIVDNAKDAVTGQKQAKITIGIEEFDNNVKVLISDTGHGIPSDLIPQLFVAPIKKSAGSKGSGVGLLLARTIVETFGGDIHVETTGPKGTTIAIILPKEQIEDQKSELSKLPSIGYKPIYNNLKRTYEDQKATNPSEYLRLYNEVSRAYEELKELDRKKTEFLSTVSHELRSPLTSIQSCIENLLSGMYGFLNEKQQSRLDAALVACLKSNST